MCTNWILSFMVLAAEFQQIRKVILITPAQYTTKCVVYDLVIMEAFDGLSSKTLFYKYKTTGGTKPRDTIKTTK